MANTTLRPLWPHRAQQTVSTIVFNTYFKNSKIACYKKNEQRRYSVLLNDLNTVKTVLKGDSSLSVPQFYVLSAPTLRKFDRALQNSREKQEAEL